MHLLLLYSNPEAMFFIRIEFDQVLENIGGVEGDCRLAQHQKESLTVFVPLSPRLVVKS